MVDKNNIIETIKMIEEDELDIRTITMGISLIDCADSDIDVSCEKIYQKIKKYASRLNEVANDISMEYGIPIINKRISVTPISILYGVSKGDPVKYAITLDRVAKELNIDFVGGYSALVQKGMTYFEKEFIDSIPKAMSLTDVVCSSVNIGSSKAGINIDAVKKMGEVILESARLTCDRNSIGAAKIVVFCNSVEDNPFMAGAYHGIGESDVCINVGISGPGVVYSAIKKAGDDKSIDEICEIIKKTAFKITRVGQLVGSIASDRLNVPFGIVDLSLAPTIAVKDSVAHILEAIGLESCGGPGTTLALAMLNDAVKKGGAMACSSVGGLSGAFIPVSEDQGMIDAVLRGSLNIEKLEAMSAVCSVGLDMIAISGDTSASSIAGIIGDEASIGMINNKTTAVRIIPAFTDEKFVVFDDLLGYAPIMEVKKFSCEKLFNRGGRVPAPLQALKN